jgi:hypothetical protein
VGRALLSIVLMGELWGSMGVTRSNVRLANMGHWVRIGNYNNDGSGNTNEI